MSLGWDGKEAMPRIVGLALLHFVCFVQFVVGEH